MALTFRHFKQVLSTWTSYVVGHSALTDLNPGSVIRTIGEAFALEMAQVNVQIQNLLNIFSVDKASGDDLDERALDFGVTRKPPSKASGTVAIGDSAIVSAPPPATLTMSVTAGMAGLPVSDATAWPNSGTAIVERGGANREAVAFTRMGNMLNLTTPLTKDHAEGTTVQVSTVGQDRTIAAGTVVTTGGNTPVRFATSATAVLLDGDASVTVPVQSQATGAANNVSAGAIVQFESPPFPTATVASANAMQGGSDLESDDAFRARIKDSQQSLSSSTTARIESEALKVVMDDTGQRVVSAKLVEPVAPGLSVLFISDGTAGFAPSQSNVTQNEVLVNNAKLGQTRFALGHWPLVAGTESIALSLERGTSTGVGAGSLTDASKSWTTDQFASWALKDAVGAFYTVTGNDASSLTLQGTKTPATGSYALFAATGTYPTGSALVRGTHYVINNTNGQMQLLPAAFPAGLQGGDSVVAFAGSSPAYIYYTGLLQKVQRVINGDPADFATYPGVKAAGTQVHVQVPTLVRVPIHGIIVAQTGVDEQTLRLPVQQAIVGYVNSLGIGDSVLAARIVEAAVSVSGVFDFQLQQPALNVVIGDDQLAKISLSDVVVN